MSTWKSFCLGSCFAVALLGAFHLISPATAALTGPYQLMNHSNTTANAGIFRLDTSSGAVSYCFISNNNELTCTKEIR